MVKAEGGRKFIAQKFRGHRHLDLLKILMQLRGWGKIQQGRGQNILCEFWGGNLWLHNYGIHDWQLKNTLQNSLYGWIKMNYQENPTIALIALQLSASFPWLLHAQQNTWVMSVRDWSLVRQSSAFSKSQEMWFNDVGKKSGFRREIPYT